MNYLLELRNRLIRSILLVVLIFGVLCFFANNIYDFLTIPLLKYLPQGQKLIATGITTPFIAPLKLTFIAAIFIAIPFLLYQLWAFIAPALYKQERQLAWLLLTASTALFYFGIAFAYFLVFPWVFKFFIHTAPSNVEVRPDINQFLDFSLKLFFAFGLAFEVPIATVVLVWSGVTSIQQLKQKRPYIIVGAFVVAMLLTPPDVLSQILLAIPLWLLFELGLWMAQWLELKKTKLPDNS